MNAPWHGASQSPYSDHGAPSSETPARPQSVRQADRGLVSWRRDGSRADARLASDGIRPQWRPQRWECPSSVLDARASSRDSAPSSGKALGEKIAANWKHDPIFRRLERGPFFGFPRPRPDKLTRWNPPDYGFHVTIGIAVRSFGHDFIVTVSDQMISFDNAVAPVDGAVRKDHFIGKNWGVLFASNNPSHALPMIRRANELIAVRGGQEALGDVEAAFCDAYAEIRQQYITRKYLSKFDIVSVAQLRAEGPRKLGSKLFWSLADRIDNEALGDTTFLVYGYDNTNNVSPHLFRVDGPGNAYSLDYMPYFAIGSGASIAMAYLNARPMGHLTSAELIYRACEAKFLAEPAGAGHQTSVFIHNRNALVSPLLPGTLSRMREIWEASRYDRPPGEVNKMIAELPDDLFEGK